MRMARAVLFALGTGHGRGIWPRHFHFYKSSLIFVGSTNAGVLTALLPHLLHICVKQYRHANLGKKRRPSAAATLRLCAWLAMAVTHCHGMEWQASRLHLQALTNR